VIADLARADWFVPDALIVVERPRRTVWEWPAALTGVREKKYGETMLWYGHPSA
jgi:16S rRNA (guanine966-N2)-methyltransferase